jgi:iron complex outermembrane receptor protein
VIGQVVRNSPSVPTNPEGITSVLVLPINAANDRTSGLDFNVHYLLETDRVGSFGFNFGYTYVMKHEIQLFAGDPVVDELRDLYDYVIPRDKANASVAWTLDKVSTTVYGARLGGLPNYDGTERLGPTFLYNASVNYRVSNRLAVGLIVDNLFDRKPARDSTWTSYPFYSRSWFNPTGRAWFAEVNYRFGGSAP